MPLTIFGIFHKSPADIVKHLKEALVHMEKSDKRCEKTVEEVGKWIQQYKAVICGHDGQQPTLELVAQLTHETYQSNVLPMLIRNLAKLEFESKKDVVLIFNNVLRRQIGQRFLTVDYLNIRPEVLQQLVHGQGCSDVSVMCGSMLRECIRHELLAKLVLYDESFYVFFEYVERSTFDIASDAFSTFKDLLTTHPTMAAEFLDANYDKFFAHYNQLLNSKNYVTRRLSVKLLGELLNDQRYENLVPRYVSNADNLKLMMNLLHEKSNSIQFEALHVFKVFLESPDKPESIEDILLRNREKLVEFLAAFRTERFLPEVEKFNEEKEHLVKMMQDIGA